MIQSKKAIVLTFLIITIMAVIGISFYTVNQRQNNRHSGVVPFQKQKTTSTRKRNVRKNTILDLDEEERIIQSSISFNEDGTTDTSIPTSIDEFHSTTTTSTTTFPFVSSFNLNSLQHILDIIVPKDDLSKQYNQPLPHTDIKEIDFVTPMEETTYYDADAPESNTYGPRLKFVGNSKSMSYLSTALFSVADEIGGKSHFVGSASFGDELTVKLHISTPPGDSFWYVTLKDIIKKNSNGENQTPVVAYTDCNTNPWDEEGEVAKKRLKCQWMVHEGPDVGWKKSTTLKLMLV